MKKPTQSKINKINKAVGAIVKETRKKNNFSQSDLGYVLGLHQAAMCRIERGEQQLSIAQLVILTGYFGEIWSNVKVLTASSVQPTR